MSMDHHSIEQRMQDLEVCEIISSRLLVSVKTNDCDAKMSYYERPCRSRMSSTF